LTRRISRADGFTLVELLVSTVITLTVTAAVFTVMNPSDGIFQAQPEVADLQQRLRVGVDTLQRDLMMAGAGAYAGSQSGTLIGFFAPIQPSLMGYLPPLDDPPGTFRSDAITVFYVPQTAVQTTLSQGFPEISAEFKVNSVPGCPPRHLCGLEEGMQVLLFDESGSFDSLTMTRVNESSGHVERNKKGPLSKSYDARSKVVEVKQHVYYLDSATDQLVHYDGYRTTAAVMDNVVGLTLEYLGEPVPPVLRRPGIDRSTTYGPAPPALGDTQAPWPAGENCTMTVLAGQHVPRLAALGAPGSSLLRLTASDLTDGPWCPDAASPDRYDADLLRVRAIRVTLRVQAGNPQLRGALGAGEDVLFARPGTSRGGYRLVPDQVIRFDVTPRNLNVGR
jgi:hypothetical protein